MVRKKYSRKEIAFGVLASFMTILVLTFYLWHITESVHLGYAIGRGEKELEKLEDDLKKLKTKKAALLSLDHIEKKAREQMKMTETREDQIIYEDFFKPLPL